MAAALDLALVGPLEGGADGDDPMGAQHLQLEVCVVGDSHELCIAWTSQDGVESFREPNHLEGEGFSPVIELIPKGNGQINLLEWHGLLPRHDAVERCLGGAEARPVNAHHIKRLGIPDVEAATTIHEDSRQVGLATDRVNDKEEVSRLRNVVGVILHIESDRDFRPF